MMLVAVAIGQLRGWNQSLKIDSHGICADVLSFLSVDESLALPDFINIMAQLKRKGGLFLNPNPDADVPADGIDPPTFPWRAMSKRLDGA